MATISFDYPKEKIDKLDEFAQKEGRNRSAYIQKVLLEWLSSSVNEPKKKIKLKRK
jgi:metal-responsive CopG/Arc/MetJ family transcriptional regulator